MGSSQISRTSSVEAASTDAVVSTKCKYKRIMNDIIDERAWLENQIQKSFRVSPDHFPVCNANLLRAEPAKELARI